MAYKINLVTLKVRTKN